MIQEEIARALGAHVSGMPMMFSKDGEEAIRAAVQEALDNSHPNLHVKVLSVEQGKHRLNVVVKYFEPTVSEFAVHPHGARMVSR